MTTAATPPEPWDHADYYDCSPDAESLSSESPEEAIEACLDWGTAPGADVEAFIAECSPIEVFAWTRKCVTDAALKLWVYDLADRLNERWVEDEYGDPESDLYGNRTPPGDDVFAEALMPILEAAVKRAHVWHCDGIGKREFSKEQVIAMMREHVPHWFVSEEEP